MRLQVFLNGIGVIERLRNAISGFEGVSREIIVSAAVDIARFEERLQERWDFLSREVSEALDDIASCEAYLSLCENSGFCDEEGNYIEPDCSSAEMEVDRARDRMNRAEETLERIRCYRLRFESLLSEYSHVESCFRHQVVDLSADRDLYFRRVADDYSRCLQVQPLITRIVEKIKGSECGKSEVDQTAFLFEGSGSERAAIEAAWQILRTSSAGEVLLKIATAFSNATKQRTKIRFDKIDAHAAYSRGTNTVTLNSWHANKGQASLAAHIAHELTHLEWFEPGSLEQEKAAFRNQAAVWSALRGVGEEDFLHDIICVIVEGPEKGLDEFIRTTYKHYPERFECGAEDRKSVV